MKRKLSPILAVCLVLSLLLALPVAAYVRVSYGADHMADRAELIKTALHGDTFHFSQTDFKQALGVARLEDVTVLTLPKATDGVLKLHDKAVVGGQIIQVSELSALAFIPASDKMEDTTFSFCVNTASGTTALTCRLRTAERVNYAPTVETLTAAELSVETQKGVGVYGCMQAEDPEGDALTYLIISYPAYGNLTVLDSESGEFRYLPSGSKTGPDQFTYVARDAYGNYSTVATVNITVNDRKSNLVYADMEQHIAYYAALMMADKNIMLGNLEGDSMYFHPEGEVTRGEFVVMAMKSAGIKPASGVKKTWFDDDSKIQDPIKGYIATAQLYGYVNGSFDGTGLYFRPDNPITRAEAAVIIHRMVQAATPTVLPTIADAATIPAWAADAMYALHDCDILSLHANGEMAATAVMTRAEAADTLYALLRYTA